MLALVQPTFLYPTIEVFPFDKVCGSIVRELEKRNWRVPGLTVTFDNYGSGYEKFRHVYTIEGENFSLRFSRTQRYGEKWNDTAGVSDLIIPGKELSVFNDTSGPRLSVYVGNDWEADRQWFMHSVKVNTRSHSEPRRHLVYVGKSQPGFFASSLEADDDLGRQYKPKWSEPKSYKTIAVANEFRDWLVENVLKVIKTYSEKKPLPQPEPTFTPFSAHKLGEIYTFIEGQDVRRISKGQADPNQLIAAERYAVSGKYMPLMNWRISNDGTILEEAYRGFTWCALGKVNASTEVGDEIGGKYVPGDYILKIKPSFAEGIYVADIAPQRRYRNDIAAQNPNQEDFTEEQYEEYHRLLGRTLVPIAEYNGGYEEPFVLINRELDFSEVELFTVTVQVIAAL